MIGGEFDLSSGVAVVTASMTTSVIAVSAGVNLFVSMGLALCISVLIGFFNGWLVTKTGIPSFLITLSALFMLFGLNLGFTKLITDSVATRISRGNRDTRWSVVLRLQVAMGRRGWTTIQHSDLVVAHLRRHRHLHPSSHTNR